MIKTRTVDIKDIPEDNVLITTWGKNPSKFYESSFLSRLDDIDRIKKGLGYSYKNMEKQGFAKDYLIITVIDKEGLDVVDHKTIMSLFI
jgi:hypothetical protein